MLKYNNNQTTAVRTVPLKYFHIIIVSEVIIYYAYMFANANICRPKAMMDSLEAIAPLVTGIHP